LIYLIYLSSVSAEASAGRPSPSTDQVVKWMKRSFGVKENPVFR
jgi:hypothetical protein